jgi:hypothetical protein
MNIKSINNNVQFSANVENSSKKDSKESPEKIDKVEISDKAKEMSKISSNDKDLEVYREKILNKFYDSNEVIKKISAQILKDIK